MIHRKKDTGTSPNDSYTLSGETDYDNCPATVSFSESGQPWIGDGELWTGQSRSTDIDRNETYSTEGPLVPPNSMSDSIQDGSSYSEGNTN